MSKKILVCTAHVELIQNGLDYVVRTRRQNILIRSSNSYEKTDMENETKIDKVFRHGAFKRAYMTFLKHANSELSACDRYIKYKKFENWQYYLIVNDNDLRKSIIEYVR